ncbi:MAG TPA: ASKHA domain-containing protein [Bacillota bacterium]|nr:ASKHA domain-containing protein [Bacillota bacterium]
MNGSRQTVRGDWIVATLTLFMGNRKRIEEVKAGDFVADALRRLGVWLDLPCGGVGSCGGCRIEVRGALSPPTPRELQSFSQEALKAGWRLACQTRILGDLEIVLTEIQRINATEEPSSVQEPQHLLGMALDLGTTTLEGRIYDLETRQMLSEGSLVNPQLSLGADLITRIQFALEPNGGETLKGLVLQGINKLIERLTKQLELSPQQITQLTIAGNSVMVHLLLGLNMEGLSAFPFQPSMTASVTSTAGEIGIGPERAMVYLFPLIGGFVGGDAVAGIISTGMDHESGPHLLIDLGTNGEVVLSTKDVIWAASTAAGPAFEGGEISWGMRAEEGAILDLDITNDWRIKTIGNAPPRGIAGSGLIRITVRLLSAGILRPDGRIKKERELSMEQKALVGERLRQGVQGLEILLDPDRQIALTQMDIRQLQLAKGAIRSAVDALLQDAGLKPESLQKVYVAGAFGSHVDAESLLKIGVLPEMAGEKIRPAGNSSLAGAAMALFSEEVRSEAEELARRIRHLTLETKEDYQEMFVKALGFPG